MSAEQEKWIELARAQTERFWRDLGSEFGLLTEADVAQSLGVDSDVPSRLRQGGELLAVDRVGTIRYPGFQISGGRLRPVIARLTELRLRHNLSETDVIYWLCAPTTYVRDERRPVDHIDEPDIVVRAAAASWGVVF